MKTHTPGPWNMEYDETGGYDCMTSGWHIFAGDKDEVDNRIVTVDCGDYGETRCSYTGSSQAAANARLIAQAPKLLEALIKTTAVLETQAALWPTYIIGTNELIKSNNEIIRKTKGD